MEKALEPANPAKYWNNSEDIIQTTKNDHKDDTSLYLSYHNSNTWCQKQHQQGLQSMVSIAQPQELISSINDINPNTSTLTTQSFASEKPEPSNTPPSPADSGVLCDSKSENGAVAPTDKMFDESNRYLNSQSTHAQASSKIGPFAPTIDNNLIAAIWSDTPVNNQFEKEQELQQKINLQSQYRLPTKTSSLWSDFNDMMMPPGLHDGNLLPCSNSSYLPSQSLQSNNRASNFGASNNQLSRSTSFQPATNQLGFHQVDNGSFDLSSLDRNLPASYASPWTNTNNLNSLTAKNMYKNMTLLNIQNNAVSNNQTLNQSLALTQSSFCNGFGASPRLSRSLSNPVGYGNLSNGLCNLSPFDDYYRPNDTQTRSLSTMASEFTQNDRIDFQVFYDMLRNENLQLRNNSNNPSGLNQFLSDTNPMASLIIRDRLGDGMHYSQLANRFRYSRKVFVGGLPPDIDEDQIRQSFSCFGKLTVDWPHKTESRSYFPPKGYAFLIFQDDFSVWSLISCCSKDGDKLYYRVSSPTQTDKQVQIRPWKTNDADFNFGSAETLDGRKTIFVGGVPRPLRAVELALIMERLYGGVCYAGIDVDQDLKYPKGAGRVAFNNQRSYIAAISARYVQLKEGDINKRVEVKPYVVDDQLCDDCQGVQSNRKYAPYFCNNVTCLKYYCDACWNAYHSVMGREHHKPLTKDGSNERTPKSSRNINW